MKQETSRIKNISCALLYSIAFSLCYYFFQYKYFKYAGVKFYYREYSFIFLTFIVSVLPIIFYRGYNSVSSIISIFIYILLYVPTIITFAFGCNEEIETIIVLQLFFFAAMSAYFLTDKVVFSKSFDNSKYAFIKPEVFAGLTIITVVYMIYVYRGNLKFVNFEKVYELRFANDDLGKGTMIAYFSSWLNTVFMPVCLIYGIMNKKKTYFLLAIFACIIIYMATGSKDALLKPAVIFGLYFLFSKDRINKAFRYMIIPLSIFTFFYLYIDSIIQQKLLLWIGSILYNRTIGIGGQNNVMYYDFFSKNQHTHYSHIGLVNFFTKSYPYDRPLGLVMGKHYFNKEEYNINANFWATDGFAANGIAGFIFINIIFILLLIFLNTITQKYDKKFLLLMFVPFIFSFLNVSLFQTMWSGGGLFLVIIFLFSKNSFFVKKRSL